MVEGESNLHVAKLTDGYKTSRQIDSKFHWQNLAEHRGRLPEHVCHVSSFLAKWAPTVWGNRGPWGAMPAKPITMESVACLAHRTCVFYRQRFVWYFLSFYPLHSIAGKMMVCCTICLWCSLRWEATFLGQSKFHVFVGQLSDGIGAPAEDVHRRINSWWNRKWNFPQLRLVMALRKGTEVARSAASISILSKPLLGVTKFEPLKPPANH